MSDRHVRRTGDHYSIGLANLLPRGLAWPRRNDSVLQKVVKGLANFWGYVDGRAADLLERESDPRQTIELLSDWERNWGLPDPCYTAPQSVDERQRALVQRMTLLGAQSRKFYIDVAAFLGYTISITEYRPFFIAMDRCGDSRVYGVNATPYYLDNDTKILAHFDGPDLSTSFVDETGKTFTAVGTAHIDWSQKRYGSSAMVGDGAGGGFTTPDHADFNLGSGNFTIEAWFRIDATDAGGSQRLMAGQINSTSTAASTSFYIERMSTNKMRALFGIGAGNVSVQSLANYTGSTNPGWHHFAVVRSGTSLMMFIDGVLQNTSAMVGTVNNSTNLLAIGRGGEIATASWKGWIDEFRLSLIARYTAAGFEENLTSPIMRNEWGQPIMNARGDAPVAVGALSEWPHYGLGPLANRYYWTVHVATAKLVWFRCASGQCGVDPHLRIGIADDLECLLNRWKPAHTQIVFDYSGLTAGGPMAGTP